MRNRPVDRPKKKIAGPDSLSEPAIFKGAGDEIRRRGPRTLRRRPRWISPASGINPPGVELALVRVAGAGAPAKAYGFLEPRLRTNEKTQPEGLGFVGAGDEIRTRDVNLGKVALYH